MPAELVGQCAILRNEGSEEAPVLPPVKPRRMEKLRNRLYLCKHNGECWKCAAEITLLVKTWLLTHARDGVRLASDQRPVWPEAGCF